MFLSIHDIFKAHLQKYYRMRKEKYRMRQWNRWIRKFCELYEFNKGKKKIPHESTITCNSKVWHFFKSLTNCSYCQVIFINVYNVGNNPRHFLDRLWRHMKSLGICYKRLGEDIPMNGKCFWCWRSAAAQETVYPVRNKIF